MTIIAFYYLLRVGEYTYHNPKAKRKTRQFGIDDVAFWHETTKIPQTKSTKYLIAKCTAATLSVKNQKNEDKNKSVHQEALKGPLCPIQALIRRVKEIRRLTRNPTACLGTYFDESKQEIRLLNANDITAAIRQSWDDLKLHKKGLTKNLVSSHSLRAGGAMAMYLNGVPHDTIRKMGRWKSDTFLMYIHKQIAVLSAGITSKMSNKFPFHNIQFQR